jgi:hypothetical protein
MHCNPASRQGNLFLQAGIARAAPCERFLTIKNNDMDGKRADVGKGGQDIRSKNNFLRIYF